MKPTPVVASQENVYEEAEDSFFLLDCLEKDEAFLNRFASPAVAELGTGTGIVSAFIPQLISQNYVALATDINPAATKCAVATWKLNWPDASKLEVMRGNLLDFVRPNVIDILLFNPPYVPSESVPPRPEGGEEDDKWVDLALDGGLDGMEVTNMVLDSLDRYLSPEGAAYILFIAGNHPDKVSERMQAQGWHSVHMDTRRAGREVLSVYRFSRNK